jgi:hypothetical protein
MPVFDTVARQYNRLVLGGMFSIGRKTLNNLTAQDRDALSRYDARVDAVMGVADRHPWRSAIPVYFFDKRVQEEMGHALGAADAEWEQAHGGFKPLVLDDEARASISRTVSEALSKGAYNRVSLETGEEVEEDFEEAMRSLAEKKERSRALRESILKARSEFVGPWENAPIVTEFKGEYPYKGESR